MNNSLESSTVKTESPQTKLTPQQQEQQAVENLTLYNKSHSLKNKNKILQQKLQHQKLLLKQNLTGETLSQDSSIDDPLAWIQKQKQLASNTLKNQTETDESYLKSTSSLTYTSSDLSGIKVAHNIQDFSADTILTLKDSYILDDTEDELLNVHMADSEKTKQNLLNKTKRPGYVAYDDDEFNNPGIKRNILSQYDNDVDVITHKNSGFVLSKNPTIKLPDKKKSVSESLKANTLSLDFEKNIEINDYYTPAEIMKFKKPKKSKKNRNSRKPLDVPDKNKNDMQIESEHEIEIDYSKSNKNADLQDINFVDDDELQAALSRARKLVSLKKHDPKLQVSFPNMDIESDDEDSNHLIISDTTEFVRNLSTASSIVKKENIKQEILDSNVHDNLIPVDNLNEVKVKIEDQSQDTVMSDVKVKIEDTKDDKMAVNSDEDEEDETGLEAEPLVSGGMAATLALLSQRGIVSKPSTEQLEKQKKIQERELWLINQRKKEKLLSIEKEKERERNRALGRHGKLSGRDQERLREEESRRAEKDRLALIEEKFKNYTPDVKIEYHDEFGRVLNTKEAYKQLAHKFHGTNPGKKKTEKRLQRIQEENQLKQLSSSAIPLNATEAFLETAKDSGSAYLVLSKGNRAVDLPTPAARSEIKPIPKQPTIVIDTKEIINTDDTRAKVTFGMKRKAETGLKPIADKKQKDQ